MLKKNLFTALLSAFPLIGFSADLVGTWNIRNYNTVDSDILFGILSEANSIQFKQNGTYYCNDSISGTYTMKGNDLVLKRNKKNAKSLEKKHGKATNAEMADYACDSLKLSFSKGGNKALTELDQNKYDGVINKDSMSYGIIFELTKQGTNGINEDLNAGKSVIGKWRYHDSAHFIIFDFKEDGVGEMTLKTEFGDLSKTLPFKYEVEGNHITMTTQDERQVLDSEFVIGTNCIYIIDDSEGTSVALKYYKLQ